MRVSASVLAVAAFAASVSAQSTVPEYNSSLSMEIDPNSITAGDRARFCRGQQNGCRGLCGSTASNSCDRDTLDYECTCSSNNSAPGLQYYANTMPTLICQELFGQCNQANIGNADNQEACLNNIFAECDPATLLEVPDPTNSDDDESTETTTSSAPPATSTTSGADDSAEDDVETSTSDGFAAPTLSPVGNGAAVAAALGVLAYMI
ncbi:hypothetical protein B0I35DRAFT_139273 [Stachybotrys elegans]|uniref:DUF7707 domain-containing protein n=1 Tax=Stachybotrys elegans TaxID=80388 RepID=A0A8K0T000_9HYPO|nr:hypothetical protein B0I35DRAFT_139273 [Stachybotrys elegans]